MRHQLDPTNRLWEEGIVEQLQRLLRQPLLRHLGIAVPEEWFLPDDVQHPFNGYIRTLEHLRTAAGDEAESFYLRMLRATLNERATIIVAAARTLSVQQGEGTS